jgi:hypothetical protein
MGFFNSVLGGAAFHDPTVEWSFVPDLPTPVIRLSGRLIGPLGFGAPLAAAQVFGRPGQFRRVHHDYFELVYARAGFQLDFEADRLAYAAFFVGPDAFEPRQNLHYCRPVEAEAGQFSGQTTQEVLEQSFGKPVSIDRDEQETIVNFARDGLVLEFELNQGGKLKRWNLYPEEPRR